MTEKTEPTEAEICRKFAEWEDGYTSSWNGDHWLVKDRKGNLCDVHEDEDTAWEMALSDGWHAYFNNHAAMARVKAKIADNLELSLIYIRELWVASVVCYIEYNDMCVLKKEDFGKVSQFISDARSGLPDQARAAYRAINAAKKERAPQ